MENITELVEKNLQDFTISNYDWETLKAMLDSADDKDRPSIFFSLTHLKYNYITLTHLFNLAELAKLGFCIVIVLWDMNILSNPYFKKVEFEKYRDWTSEQYINKKRDEILSLATSLGIEKVKVYNSSEIWSRFMQKKDRELFAKYYSVLSTIDLDECSTDEKLNYLIQLPADIFFANFFEDLFPEDVKRPIEVIYSSPARRMLYFATRKAMHNEGLTSTERPIVILSKEIPRIEIDAQIPHWDMTASEINQIMSRWQFEKSDLENLYKNVLGKILCNVSIITNTGVKTVQIDTAVKELLKESQENIVSSASKNFFTYFQKAKEITKNLEAPRPAFHAIKTKKELKQLSTLLKSENVMKILVLANGARTISEIAKDMSMQLSNASQYIAKLKKASLVTIKNKKVIRTARGLTVNFETSLGD